MLLGSSTISTFTEGVLGFGSSSLPTCKFKSINRGYTVMSLCNDSLKIHLLVLSLLYEDIFRVLRNKMRLGYTRHKIGL